MWFRTALVAAMTVLSVGAAQAQDDNPIIQRMAAFMQAYNAKNAGAIAQFYTEDGAVLPPQGAPVLGREQIAAHYAQAFNGVESMEYRVIEIRQTGPNAAVEIGEGRVQAGGQTVATRSLHLWLLLEDGTWFLNRDMYQVLGAAN